MTEIMEAIAKTIQQVEEEVKAETPFYDQPGWKPMTEDQISRALEQLQGLPGSEMMYLPEFYCRKKGVDFEDANRTLSLKESIEAQKRKPVTARERLQAKLEERKKSAASRE
jgi:hypothetical protein